MIGVGAHEAAPGPWTLLALPGAVLATLALIRTAIVGPRSTLFQNMQRQRRSDRPRSVGATRAWVVFCAVLTAFAGGLAIAAALPARPSVDVAGLDRAAARPDRRLIVGRAATHVDDPAVRQRDVLLLSGLLDGLGAFLRAGLEVLGVLLSGLLGGVLYL